MGTPHVLRVVVVPQAATLSLVQASQPALRPITRPALALALALALGLPLLAAVTNPGRGASVAWPFKEWADLHLHDVVYVVMHWARCADRGAGRCRFRTGLPNPQPQPVQRVVG